MKDRKKSYFKKVGDSLPKIVNKNISERSFVELSLIKNWNKIIGKEIACYCWPIKMVFSNIKNGFGFVKNKPPSFVIFNLQYELTSFIIKFSNIPFSIIC